MPGSNALDLQRRVKDKMDELATRFPHGIAYAMHYDTTRFVSAAMRDVVVTLLEALALVIFVVFVFLQNWRATIIPTIAIPVSLVATLAVMQIFGFSLNMLSLLGMVLAIGLVVDDAIVVVENVERQLEAGLPPLAAAKKAMAEVTGPIIATTAVLMAVFVPVAFIPGVAGRLYNQFALTVAISVGISAFNSLTLSPALSAAMLRHGPKGSYPNVIVTRRLTKYYHGRPAVDGLDLRVPQGCVYGFLGRNGAGKSTAIKMLLGMVHPDYGQAEFLGEAASALRPGTRAQDRVPCRGTSAVSRDDRSAKPSVSPARSIPELERPALGADPRPLRGFRPAEDPAAVQRPAGQVSLALAVASDPELLILDDPTLGLDTVVRRDFLESLIQIIQHRGRTIFSARISSATWSGWPTGSESWSMACCGSIVPRSISRIRSARWSWSSPARRPSSRPARAWSAAGRSAGRWS